MAELDGVRLLDSIDLQNVFSYSRQRKLFWKRKSWFWRLIHYPGKCLNRGPVGKQMQEPGSHGPELNSNESCAVTSTPVYPYRHHNCCPSSYSVHLEETFKALFIVITGNTLPIQRLAALVAICHRQSHLVVQPGLREFTAGGSKLSTPGWRV
jgi:hypothetical protein